jgi:hypothetical protein
MIDIDNIPKIGCVYKITSPGPNRYSYDGLFNRGYTNDFKLS